MSSLAQALLAPGIGYLAEQQAIDSQMREHVVNWMADTHWRARQQLETLYLAVSLFDRFLSTTPVPLNKVILVGATCVFIASKFEQLFRSEVCGCIHFRRSTLPFLYLHSNLCVRLCMRARDTATVQIHLEELANHVGMRVGGQQDIRDCEVAILRAIRFRVSCPTAYTFVTHYIERLSLPRTQALYVHFVCECMLQHYSMLAWRPSVLAAAALVVGSAMHNRHAHEPVEVLSAELVASLTNTSLAEVSACCDAMLAIVEKPRTYVLYNVILDKYRQREFGGAAFFSAIVNFPVGREARAAQASARASASTG
ncbi:MAG: hypothetical protein EOO41_01075 [Methanobacteriota archaeon]|nr:MAG: hypothetical protein EOO41_01075 [Euryarchaeota archaeon]